MSELSDTPKRRAGLPWPILPLVGTGLLMASLFAGCLMVRDPIDQEKWDAVTVGMNKSSVIEILGNPVSLDGDQLQYSRPFNLGWVEFDYDTNDILSEKNDESILVSLTRNFPFSPSDKR